VFTIVTKKSRNLNHLLFVFILTINVAETHLIYAASAPELSEPDPQQNFTAPCGSGSATLLTTFYITQNKKKKNARPCMFYFVRIKNIDLL
jgi:hypothetical protein